jgi:hypothetical protein
MATQMHDTNSLNHKPDAVKTTAFALFREETQISFLRPRDNKIEAPAGYTKVEIAYRETAKTKEVKPPVMVMLPQITLPVYEIKEVPATEEGAAATYEETGYFLPDSARKVFLDAIEQAQADIVRAKIETENLKDGSVIEWKDVTLDAALAYLTEVRTAFRLTKEKLEVWSKEKLLKACYARGDEISAQKGYEAQSKEWSDQRNAVLARYVLETSKLAAAVPTLDQETAKSVQAMLIRAEMQQDDIGAMLLKKLHVMLNPKFVADGL